MADTVSVTQADRDLRSAILKHIVDTMDRPCGPGDMIEDRQDALDQIIARHRLASTQPAPSFPREEVAEAIRQAKVKADKVHGVAWYNLEEISRVELILAALLQGK